jgi:hypothetical protein
MPSIYLSNATLRDQCGINGCLRRAGLQIDEAQPYSEMEKWWTGKGACATCRHEEVRQASHFGLLDVLKTAKC